MRAGRTRTHTVAWKRMGAPCEAYASVLRERCERAGDRWVIDPEAGPAGLGAEFMCAEHARKRIERGPRSGRAGLEMAEGQGNDFAHWLAIDWDIAGGAETSPPRQLSRSMNRLIAHHRRREADPEFHTGMMLSCLGDMGMLDPSLRYSHEHKMRLIELLVGQNERAWAEENERFARAVALLVETGNIEPCPHPDGHDIYIDEATCKRARCSADMFWSYELDMFELERIARAAMRRAERRADSLDTEERNI